MHCDMFVTLVCLDTFPNFSVELKLKNDQGNWSESKIEKASREEVLALLEKLESVKPWEIIENGKCR